MRKDARLTPTTVSALSNTAVSKSNSTAELISVSLLANIVEAMTEEHFALPTFDLTQTIGGASSLRASVSVRRWCCCGGWIISSVRSLRTRRSFSCALPLPAPYRAATGAAQSNLAVSATNICTETAPAVLDEFSRSVKAEEENGLEKMVEERNLWAVVCKCGKTAPSLSR
jgi:hypothetical protein